jgi:pilus assembly protein Flp/PilA
MTTMNYMYLKLVTILQSLMASEEGQDLVEYALLVSLIALAAMAGVDKVANGVTNVFTRISSSLA